MNENIWSVYEANLQSYRNIFVASQSIMLAVGAILLDKGKLLVLLVACIAIFQIIYIYMGSGYSL